MNNELLLLSGGDIPFPAARLTIHQPRLFEIAYIGEAQFYKGCELLNFNKNKLSVQDKINLEKQSDFNIIMSVINDKSTLQSIEQTNSVKMVLALIFPDYQIKINRNFITFADENEEQFIIDESKYDTFKDILANMFCLNKSSRDENSQDYNPSGLLAEKIANKLKKGKAKVAQQKGLSQKVAILSRYASILAVGEGKDLNALMNYTVYQLFDEFNRFELKSSNDIYIKAKLAGAKDMKEVENWMKDIHE